MPIPGLHPPLRFFPRLLSLLFSLTLQKSDGFTGKVLHTGDAKIARAWKTRSPRALLDFSVRRCSPKLASSSAPALSSDLFPGRARARRHPSLRLMQPRDRGIELRTARAASLLPLFPWKVRRGSRSRRIRASEVGSRVYRKKGAFVWPRKYRSFRFVA